MKKEIIAETSYQRAYSSWFSRHEVERRRQKKRPGVRLLDFEAPPMRPDDLAQLVDQIGARRVLSILEISRTTLARWKTGQAVPPRSAVLLLRVLALGLLPGMSDDWRDFRFDGDRLRIVGTRDSYTAREIAGIRYLKAHADALARRVADLEKQTAHLLQVGRFDCANDALISAS